MKPTLLKETLKALYKIQRTVCIEGAPGGGKTTIVHEVADELGIPCIERHMPTMLVEDFGVLFPSKDNDTMHYRLPDWFPVKGKAPEHGILLFDDRNQANGDLQKVLANICQARTLHGVSMPDGWMVVSTGNRQSDRAGANRILTHLRNRETVLEFDTNIDDWTQWAMTHDVKTEVVAFLNLRADLLHKFDPQAEQNPTPRSWVEGVSAVMGCVSADAEFEAFKGAVGEGAAAEFVGFLRVFMTLPDKNDIIRSPDTAPILTEPSAQYAVSAACANWATKANFGALLRYLDRMAPEFSVLAVMMAVKRDIGLSATKEFTQWSITHKDVIF